MTQNDIDAVLAHYDEYIDEPRDSEFLPDIILSDQDVHKVEVGNDFDDSPFVKVYYDDPTPEGVWIGVIGIEGNMAEVAFAKEIFAFLLYPGTLR